MKTDGEIRPPKRLLNDPSAKEILRVWRTNAGQVFVARIEGWPDPAAWGLLLADLARHVAQAYASEQPRSIENALERVVAGLNAELSLPRSSPRPDA